MLHRSLKPCARSAAPWATHAHTRRVAQKAPKTGGLMAFAAKSYTCLGTGCRVPIPKKDEAVSRAFCRQCLSDPRRVTPVMTRSAGFWSFSSFGCSCCEYVLTADLNAFLCCCDALLQAALRRDTRSGRQDCGAKRHVGSLF